MLHHSRLSVSVSITAGRLNHNTMKNTANQFKLRRKIVLYPQDISGPNKQVRVVCKDLLVFNSSSRVFPSVSRRLLGLRTKRLHESLRPASETKTCFIISSQSSRRPSSWFPRNLSVGRQIKAGANSPDEDGLANLLMASPSCGPLDKPRQPALFRTALRKPQ